MSKVGAIGLNRPDATRDHARGAGGSVNRPLKRIGALIIALLIVSTTGCAIISRHQFTAAGTDWQTRNGQLLYRHGTTTLIGEVLVRFSKKTGDFELNFFKGPGVTLLMIRQDSSFAQITGVLARRGWAGQTEHAPARLRGWLQLREKFFSLKPDEKSPVIRGPGNENWTFRF